MAPLRQPSAPPHNIRAPDIVCNVRMTPFCHFPPSVGAVHHPKCGRHLGEAGSSGGRWVRWAINAFLTLNDVTKW